MKASTFHIESILQCLKITEKVAFKIAGGASYVYIHFESKGSLTMPKMANFGEFLKDLSLRSNSVTRRVTKISGNCQN